MTRNEFLKACGLSVLSVGIFKWVGDRPFENPPEWVKKFGFVKTKPQEEKKWLMEYTENGWIKTKEIIEGEPYWVYKSANPIITSYGKYLTHVRYEKLNSLADFYHDELGLAKLNHNKKIQEYFQYQI